MKNCLFESYFQLENRAAEPKSTYLLSVGPLPLAWLLVSLPEHVCTTPAVGVFEPLIELHYNTTWRFHKHLNAIFTYFICVFKVTNWSVLRHHLFLISCCPPTDTQTRFSPESSPLHWFDWSVNRRWHCCDAPAKCCVCSVQTAVWAFQNSSCFWVDCGREAFQIWKWKCTHCLLQG